MYMLTGKFPDVVVNEAGRLGDKNEIVPGVAVDFHLTQAVVFDFAPVGGGRVEMGLLGLVIGLSFGGSAAMMEGSVRPM